MHTVRYILITLPLNQGRRSNGLAMRAQTDRRTDRHTDTHGTDNITSSANAGGNEKAASQRQFHCIHQNITTTISKTSQMTCLKLIDPPTRSC